VNSEKMEEKNWVIELGMKWKKIFEDFLSFSQVCKGFEFAVNQRELIKRI
jgi:hypothetical protein